MENEYAGTLYQTRRAMLAAQLYDYITSGERARPSHYGEAKRLSAACLMYDMEDNGWRFDGTYNELVVAREDVIAQLSAEIWD